MNPDPSPNISSLRKDKVSYIDLFGCMPAKRSGNALSMLQKLSDPPARAPDFIKIQKLLEYVTHLQDLHVPQKLASDERQLLGAEKGRRKGTATTKAKGEETSARIAAHLEKIGAKPTDRGLAQKIAPVIGKDRSTVSRYLTDLKKRK